MELLTEARRERAKQLVARAVALLPWGSLVLGLVSALLMDRSPGAAKLIIPAAVLGWGALLGFALLSRVRPERFDGWKSTSIKAAQLSVLVVMQSLMQTCLFFAVPFYVLAATFVPSHMLFLAVLIGASALTLWDPWYEAAVRIPGVRLILQTLATFASVNAVLPALGMSNRGSLIVSGIFAALGVPAQAWLVSSGENKAKRVAIIGVAAAILLPLGLVLGGASVIPPAPLRLVEEGIGTGYANFELRGERDAFSKIPSQLVCATAVSAPSGLKDKLFHVWRRDGKVSDRIPLTIRGGRKEGFRTYSKKTRLWPGTWSCAVETEAGQLLGTTSVDVEGKRRQRTKKKATNDDTAEDATDAPAPSEPPAGDTPTNDAE